MSERTNTLISIICSKVTRIALLSLLAISGTLAICVSTSSVVHADTLGYPWPTDTEAPCYYGANGGSKCVNPADPTNQNYWYSWGVYDGGTFHFYRNGYEYRNCTDYTQWKESTIGVSVPGTWGNGGQWYANAPTNEQSTTSKAWDAAVVVGTIGHVAFVESVNTNGTITVSEYNHDTQGHGDTRTDTPANMGFTKYVDFGVHPSGSYPDGTFLQVNQTGNVYEVVGGAPLYVSSWANVGGQHPTTWVDQSFINGLRPYPSDNTFVQAFPSGKVYVFAGGAPLYVSSWANVGGVHSTLTVDDYPIDNHLNTRAYPTDNTFVQAFPSGNVYVFAGGAPLYISSWSNVGGVHTTVTIDDAPITNHLNTLAYPLDNTFVQAFPSGKVYVFAGGAPLYVYNWANVGGVHPTITVDDNPIDNHLNTLAYPLDNTFVQAFPSGKVYVFAGGAPLYVASWSNVGGVHPTITVDDYPIDNHLNTRAYPTDNTFVQAFPSGNVYVFAGGAPLYVYSWATIGGVHSTVTIDDAPIANHWNTLAYPVDGTYVKGYGSGEEFLAMTGAVTRVTTTPLPPATIVDDWAIVNQLGGTL